MPAPWPDEDAYLRAVGLAIESFRKAHKWDQTELGRRCSCDKNTISRWENGKTSLSAYNMSLLAEALGVDGDWLIRPADVLSEIEARAAIVRRASEAAAQADAEAELRRRDAAAASAPPGTALRRRPLRSLPRPTDQ